jgi:hypothetical protein
MGLARITNMYWAIECTPKPSFVNLLGLARITNIYKAIDFISKP